MSLLTRSSMVRADFGVTITPVQPLNANATTDAGADGATAIAADGFGHWVAVWMSNDTLGGSVGSDNDILVARSLDNGDNWSFPVPLNSNATSDSGNDGYPSIATDGHGRWVVAWASTDTLGGTIGSDSDILAARSIDNGANWSAPIPLNVNAGSDSGDDLSPQIATDGLGHWVAVWWSNDSLGNTIGPDSDILVARSIDNGANWSAPIPLNTNAADDAGFDSYPSIASDGRGKWVVVWESANRANGSMGEDNDPWVSRSVDNGANWSIAAQLDTHADWDDRYDEAPKVATDGQGHWVAVWPSEEESGHESEIFVARSADNGANWSAPVPLNSNAETDTGANGSPSIAADQLGNWVVAWYSNDGVSADTDIIVARSVDNGANWSIVTPLNSNAATDSQSDIYPALATDGRGNWVTGWETNEDIGGTGADFDILTARFALPDCNGNGIGDPAETGALLTPDLNFNGIPDACELPFLVPPLVQPVGCGGGMCGVGAAAFAPLCIVGVSVLRRSLRRRCRENDDV